LDQLPRYLSLEFSKPIPGLSKTGSPNWIIWIAVSSYCMVMTIAAVALYRYKPKSPPLVPFPAESRLQGIRGWLLVIGFVLVVALAVGPELVIGGQVRGPVPWEWLWNLLFTRNTEPLRIIIFANLLLAMIVAVWLARPARNRLLLASRWILGLAAIAGIIAYLPGLQRGYDIPAAIPAGNPAVAVQPTHALPAFFTSGVYRDYLRRGETVVVVSDRANAGMLFQAYTNFYMRLSGGFINMTFTDRTSLPVPVAALRRPTPARERAFLAYARHVGVRAIIVERAWAEPWMNIFSRMGLHGTNVGGVTVYRT